MMKWAAILTAVGIAAVLLAASGYACGAAHLGTTAGITALLCTAAGLALLDQDSRRAADLHRRTDVDDEHR